jgi:hypothetical protein
MHAASTAPFTVVTINLFHLGSSNLPHFCCNSSSLEATSPFLSFLGLAGYVYRCRLHAADLSLSSDDHEVPERGPSSFALGHLTIIAII